MKTFRRSTVIFTFILFFAGFSAPKAQTTKNIFTLPAGTQIRLKMDNEINSRVSSPKDTFTATVSSPVIIRGAEILSAGAVVEGKIVSVHAASTGNKDGSFELEFGTLQLKNDVKRVIDASLITEKSEKKSSFFQALAILGGTAAGAVLGGVVGNGKGALIGAGVGAGIGTGASFLKKGKEIRIKANEEFVIRLNKEVALPVEDF
jgi:hypothetical protein